MMVRRCGSSDLFLPVLGIGCWSFGGGEYWGAQDQHDVDEVVAAALDYGCTYFDTAEVYNDGRSESALGSALKRRRSQAIIGTKVGPHHARPADLRASCEAGLRRLQTDYIDLYMLHWPLNSRSMPHYTDDPRLIESPPDTAAAFETLCNLRDQGKIRYIGVSNFGVQQLDAVADFVVTVNQVCYNLLTRAIESAILPHCRERGIGVIGYMPLMQGILTGKYASADEIPWQRTRSRHFSGSRAGSRHGESGHEELVNNVLRDLVAVARRYDTSVMQLALAWSIAQPGIACTVNGVRDVQQLRANVAAARQSLPSAALDDLAAATADLMQAMGPSPDLYEPTAGTRVF